MNKKFSNLAYAFFIGVITLIPFKALADAPPPIEIYDPGGAVTADQVVALIQTVINWILVIAGSLAAVMLIYGGIKYIFSSGDEKRTESAKKTILYAVIGVLVITASYFIVSFAANLLSSAA